MLRPQLFFNGIEPADLARDGGSIETTAHLKFSGFYGPDGLMGILVMQKPSPKVHGSSDTIMSVVP